MWTVIHEQKWYAILVSSFKTRYDNRDILAKSIYTRAYLQSAYHV